MGGDLFEILFVIAFILFGILGGRKKKPQSGGRRSSPPRTRPAGRDAGQRARPSPQYTEDALMRELEGLLTGRRPAPAPTGPRPGDPLADPDEARSLESLEVEETETWEAGLERAAEIQQTARWRAGRDRDAVTLETLEGAGEGSHDRFHDRYDLTSPAVLRRTGPPAFDLAAVRRAVIWSEILGPPVSLR